jgi:hypothetical protein
MPPPLSGETNMNVGKGRNVMLCGVLVSMLVIVAMAATPGKGGEKKPRDVTLTGKIVDLHSYMTGKFASSDRARSTRACIHAGVPVAIEASDGLIVVGQGTKGPRKLLVRLAYQHVDLKGRLYERGGLRYIDISDAKPAEAAEEPADEGSDDPEYVEPDSEESDEPEPPVQGACCLPEGDCLDTDEEECAEAGGEFHRGAACDEIECEPRFPGAMNPPAL